MTELLYSANHIWVKDTDDGSLLGLSAYALEQLKTIIFMNLPEAGSEFEAGDTFGDVESIKTVSALVMPVHCEVIEVNEGLMDAPENMNSNVDESWLVRVRKLGDGPELMTETEYEEYTKTL